MNNICQLNRHFDCKRVISSVKNTYVEDLISFCSLSYFISNIFFATDVVSDYLVFFLVNGTALLLTLFLLVRQFFIVRKLCLFCLIVALCVIFNVVIIGDNINYTQNSIIIIRYIFLFALCVILMYFILFFTNTLNAYIIDKRKLNFYVKNKEIFNALLPSLVKYNVLDIGFKLKNKNSLGDISIIISLSCKYCYNMLKEFIFVYKNYHRFSYQIIVLVDQSCENTYQNLNNVYLKQSHDYFIEYLEKMMNTGIKCEPTHDLKVNHECERIRSLHLEHVPSILYNGYLLPSEYSLIDLCDLLEE